MKLLQLQKQILLIEQLELTIMVNIFCIILIFSLHLQITCLREQLRAFKRGGPHKSERGQFGD